MRADHHPLKQAGGALGLACGLAGGLLCGRALWVIPAALVVCCVVLLYVSAEADDREDDERWRND